MTNAIADSPSSLVLAAMNLLEPGPELYLGTRLRATALVGRQGLEAALGQFLRTHRIQPEAMEFTAQFLCLEHLLSNRNDARKAYGTWTRLSRACHFHGYELPPPVHSLRLWLQEALATTELLAEVRANQS